MKKYYKLLLSVLILGGCQSYTCDNMPEGFPSMDDAIQTVQKSSFKYTDEVKISDSSTARISEMFSWITWAKYYSCDNKVGYFTFTTSKGTMYIRKDVPIEIWKGFKNSPLKGVYFDRHINGKYGISIVNEVWK